MAGGVNNGTRRPRPNLLITETPGTGKSTTAAALAEATNLRYICVGDLVKENNLHDGWDDEFKCHVINQDLLLSFLSSRRIRSFEQLFGDSYIVFCYVPPFA